MPRALGKIIAQLRDYQSALTDKYNIEALGVFGSHVRGDNDVSSDLDILVEFSTPPSLFKFVRLQDELSDLLGMRVDLVMKSALKPKIGERILKRGSPRMSQRSYEDFLQDILTAATHAIEFIEGQELTDFQADVEKQYAVTRALEIIGEAARNVPDDAKTLYPELPWKEMIGVRNVVIHEYFGVDEVVIWRTVQDDLPPLCATIS